MPDTALVEVLLKSFGPGGLPLLLLCGAMGWMLHSRLKAERVEQQETNALRTRMLEALHANASAANHLSEAFARHEQHEKEMMEVLAEKLVHAINNGFQVVVSSQALRSHR